MLNYNNEYRMPVAPFAGAWIEIVIDQRVCEVHESLPSRERGLKSRPYYCVLPYRLSLPSRERGLKSLLKR